MNMQEILQDNSQSPDSIGALLSKARVARKLEQRDVAVRLGLDRVIIQSLEADQLDGLAAPIFIRGYLSRYARLLDIPEQALLDRYQQLGMNEPPPLRLTRSIEPQAKSTDFRWFIYPLVIVAVVWLGWAGVERISAIFGNSDTQLPLAGANGETSIPLPQQAEPAINTSTASPKKTTSEPMGTSTPVPSIPSTETPNNAATTAKNLAEEPVPATIVVDNVTEPVVNIGNTVIAEAGADSGLIPQSGVPKLELAFTEDCWVDVKDASGKRLAYGLMKANTVNTLSGQAPFSLILGNALVTNIKLNGRTVDRDVYVPKRGTVSRFVLNIP